MIAHSAPASLTFLLLLLLLLLMLLPLLLLLLLLLLQTASVMQPALQLFNPFAASTHRGVSHDDGDTTVVVVAPAPPHVLNRFGTLYSKLAPIAVRSNHNKVSRKCVARSACNVSALYAAYAVQHARMHVLQAVI
jgi:hypothetical protein